MFYMTIKRLLGLILILVSVQVFAQNPTNYVLRNARERVISFMTDSMFRVPRYNGTPSGVRVGETSAIDGAIAMDTTNHRLYIFSGNAWVRLANYSEVGSYSAGYGLGLSGSVFSADSSTLAAYFLRRKDSATGTNLDGYLTRTSVPEYARTSISLTTTGSSGAATYNSSTGVLNVPQYSGGGGSSSTSPVTYVAPPQAITDSFNLVSSTWVQNSDITWNGMIDENFVLVDERFNTNQTVNLVYGGTANDSRVSGGVFAQPGSTSLDTTGIAWGFKAEAPFYSFTVPVLKTDGAGTVDKIMMSITDEATLSTSARKAISVVYDDVASASNVKIYVRKSGTDNLRATTTLSLSVRPPFDLSLTINSQSVSVAYRIPNGDWTPFYAYLMDTTSDYDMRDTAVLKSFNKAAVYFIREGNNGYTFNIGGPSFGYSKGVSFANPSLITYDDGTPVTKGNDYYVLSSLTGTISGSNGFEQVRTTPANVLKINPTTASAKTYQKIFVERGGKIYGENSGSITYDSTRNKWIYLIPNWGSYGIATTTNIYKYETDEFKNGLVILRNGTLVSGLSGTTQYDPDLKKIGSTWYLAYTSGYGAVDGIHTATSTNLSTWVDQRTYASALEGTKLFKIGGKWRVLAATMSSGVQRVLDTTLTSLGTFTKPSNVSIGSTPAHPTILPVRVNDRTEYYWLYFDPKTIAGISYSWGNMKLLKADLYQTGHDYAIKNYSDIGDITTSTIDKKITEPNIFKRIFTSAYFDGGIGLGTGTSPNTTNHKLHIKLSGTSYRPFGIDLQNALGGATGIAFRNSTTGTNEFYAMLNYDATPRFNIGWGASDGSAYSTNYLSIASTSGNVGVSTQSPQHPFQVYGIAKFGGAANQQYGVIGLGDDATTNIYNGIYRGTSTGAIGGGNWVNMGGYDGLNFLTGNAVFGSQTKRMGIDVNGIITTTARFQTSKGSNVASAGDLSLGNGGNIFHITGTTTINAITVTNWQAGSEITLIFDSTPTVKNNTAGGGGTAVMLLAGGADFSATANDVLKLVYDGTSWFEVARSVN